MLQAIRKVIMHIRSTLLTVRYQIIKLGIYYLQIIMLHQELYNTQSYAFDPLELKGNYVSIPLKSNGAAQLGRMKIQR